ncbi:MAG: NUDIX domain-containing protein [Actinobacteria bacterium]|nr:NUDIX domain-containing protein [Actinomycetota bacterium]
MPFDAPADGPVDKHFTATGFLVRDGRVLLLWHRKLRMWLPFGGHIDAGEDPVQALLREAREETGFEVEIAGETLAFAAPEPRPLPRPETILLERIEPGHYHIDLIYFVRPVDGQETLAPGEHAEMRWFSPEELGAPEVTEDVRLLGRTAIARLAASPHA